MIINSNHWYDGVTLLTKNFNSNYTMDTEKMKLVFGKKNVRKVFYHQLKNIKNDADVKLGGVPTVIGEFGVPYDLNRKRSYKSGDFSSQAEALDLYYQIIEELFLDSTIWNYTADNSNERGDLWNDEDLSIFSPDQQVDPDNIYSGGRGLKAIIRPYMRIISGSPRSQSFDYRRKEYTLLFEDQNDGELVVFVPEYQYPRGFRVEFESGKWDFNAEEQEIRAVYRGASSNQILRILPK